MRGEAAHLNKPITERVPKKRGRATKGWHMAQAKSGDTVKVHYTGRLDDGTVFDSSADRDPLQFTIGASQVIAGFEQAATGMSLGESKTATFPADQAYGPRDERMVMAVSRDQLPPDLKVKVNDQLQMRRPDGRAQIVTVTAVSESDVTLDGNHPLAGQDLTFDIELVEIA
jgi:peptidylprolyl isomerase